MHWTHYILASAVFLALYDVAKKASVKDNAVLPTLLLSTMFGAAAFTTALAIRGGLPAALGADARTMVLAATKSVVVATSWVFTFQALRTLPITVATPIRASAPALVFIVAFFIYGETPSLAQAVGMALVFGGYFAFSWAGRHEGIDFLRSKAVWCAFGGAFFSAISSLWDKYVFQMAAAEVDQVQFWFQIFLIAVYAVLLCVGRGRQKFEFRWTIPFVGILLAAADWLYFMGLAVPGVPISVGSLMRRVSVVITFFLGARLFKETNLARKGIALAAILAGVALLCRR